MSATTHLPATDYEPRDASPQRILLVAAGIAAAVLLSLAAALALYVGRYHERPRAGAIGRQTSFRDSPHAQTDIAADWSRLEPEVHEHLETYGWIDRDAGVVHIPIDIAMQRLVDEAANKKDSK